jgi:hypothetical protein
LRFPHPRSDFRTATSKIRLDTDVQNSNYRAHRAIQKSNEFQLPLGKTNPMSTSPNTPVHNAAYFERNYPAQKYTPYSNFLAANFLFVSAILPICFLRANFSLVFPTFLQHAIFTNTQFELSTPPKHVAKVPSKRRDRQLVRVAGGESRQTPCAAAATMPPRQPVPESIVWFA